LDKLLFDWAKHGHLTLALEGSENTNHFHIVNSLAISNGQTVFLDSIDTGSESQTAESQAALAVSVMATRSGVSKFAAVATENASACIRIRNDLAEQHPGLVPMADQAHCSGRDAVESRKGLVAAEDKAGRLLCVTRTRVPYIARTTLVHRNIVNIDISNAPSLYPHSPLPS
jgi:hypothetical protein